MGVSFSYKGGITLHSREIDAACNAVIETLLKELPEETCCYTVMASILEETKERLGMLRIKPYRAE